MSIKIELERYMPEDIAWMIEEKRLEQIEKDARERMAKIHKILSFDYDGSMEIKHYIDWFYLERNTIIKHTKKLYGNTPDLEDELYFERYVDIDDFGLFEVMYDYFIHADLIYYFENVNIPNKLEIIFYAGDLN